MGAVIMKHIVFCQLLVYNGNINNDGGTIYYGK